MRKRWWWLLTGLCVVLIGGYGVKYYLSQKIADEVVKVAADPEVKKAIDKAMNSGDGQKQLSSLIDGQAKTAVAVEVGSKDASNQATTNSTDSATATSSSSSDTSSSSSEGANQSGGSSSNNSGDKPVQFKNRSEAVSYAMSKFTATEIAHLLSEYNNRKNLSAAEKRSIRNEVLSRFTASELSALQQAASK